MQTPSSIVINSVLLLLTYIGCSSSDVPASESARLPTDSTVESDVDNERVLLNQPPPSSFRGTQQSATRQTSINSKQHKIEQNERIQEQKDRAKEKIKEILENPHQYSSDAREIMSGDEVASIKENIMKHDPILEREENRWLRNSYNDDQSDYFTNAAQYIDEWAQAYRMLGVYIECNLQDQKWSYYGGGNNGNYDGDDEGCKRWVIWAAYANPNYQGFGIDEYTGINDDDYYDNAYSGSNQYSGGCSRNNDGSYSCNQANNNQNTQRSSNTEATSELDCHSLNTEWKLIGVYRENFYDFFEQISKHMWYYNSYEYTTAIEGLEYIGDGDCEQVGSDSYGNSLYKAPKPVQGGSFIIGLYVDSVCLTPYENDNVNADNVGDNGNAYGYYNNKNNDYYDYGNVQEYTLAMFNEVYGGFKYCTLCLDYPSYQDGYFNGDGYDDEDLINQCWKFFSHDSYQCDSSCVASASAQGTINAFNYRGRVYGTSWDGSANGASRFSSFSRSKLSGRAGTNPADLYFGSCAFLFFVSGLLYYFSDDLKTMKRNRTRKRKDEENKGLSLLGAQKEGKDKKRGLFSKRDRSEPTRNTNGLFGMSKKRSTNKNQKVNFKNIPKDKRFQTIQEARKSREAEKAKPETVKVKKTKYRNTDRDEDTTMHDNGTPLQLPSKWFQKGRSGKMERPVSRNKLSLPALAKNSRSERGSRAGGGDSFYRPPSAASVSSWKARSKEREKARSDALSIVEISSSRPKTAPGGTVIPMNDVVFVKPNLGDTDTSQRRSVSDVLNRHKNSYHRRAFVQSDSGSDDDSDLSGSHGGPSSSADSGYYY